jgi:hypothetical protein
MLIKNTENSLKLMDLIYNQTQFINAGNWEQEGFINIYEKNIENMRQCMEIRFNEFYSLQSYLPDLKSNYFIVHLAGFRTIDWVAYKIFKRLYPLQRSDETIEDYTNRMQWYHTDLEKSIQRFYDISPYELIECE